MEWRGKIQGFFSEVGEFCGNEKKLRSIITVRCTFCTFIYIFLYKYCGALHLFDEQEVQSTDNNCRNLGGENFQKVQRTAINLPAKL